MTSRPGFRPFLREAATLARDRPIRERRKTLAWDQVELAERVGASRRWLIQVERGKSGASFGLLLRTLHALGLGMELTSGDDRTQSTDGAPCR